MRNLKADIIEARIAACRDCPHALPGPQPWQERKFFCGLLHDGTPNRRQAAYLPVLVERADCPDHRWAPVTDQSYRLAGDPPPQPEPLYHTLWREIHDPRRHWDLSFMRSISARLPCGPCREALADYQRANPVPYGDDARCWAWGVELHNTLNRRLGKPVLTVAQAMEIHAKGADRTAVEAVSIDNQGH